MKKMLAVLLLTICSTASADLMYEGTWVTYRNIKLKGRMSCEVKQTGKDKWHGRFFGRWQGRPFEYNVDFTGPADNLKGKARIDGASYDWKGKIDRHSPGNFKGTFTGSRYTGRFDLKQKVPKRK